MGFSGEIGSCDYSQRIRSHYFGHDGKKTLDGNEREKVGITSRATPAPAIPTGSLRGGSSSALPV